MTTGTKKMNKHFFPQLSFLITVLLTAGCAPMVQPSYQPAPVPVSQPQPAAVSAMPAQQSTTSQASDNDVNACRRALDSLQKINPTRGNKLRSEFDALVGAASQYGSVRSQVGGSIKETVDAMYQFKTMKICADIEKELMDSLVTRGESVAR